MYPKRKKKYMKSYLKKLEDQIRSRSNEVALADYQGSAYTYAQIAAEIERLHCFFRLAGLQKGDKVALVARNSAKWAIFFLAVNTYEAVIVPILPNFTPEGAAQLIHHSDSILLITDQDIFKQLDMNAIPQIRGILNAREDKMLWGQKEILEAWENRNRLFGETYPKGFSVKTIKYPDHPEQVAIINYTSGTSGNPKGVMLTYGAMSDIVEYSQHNIYPDPQILISMLPLAHIYGLAMEFIYPVCTGFTIHFLGKTPSPSLLVQAMQEIRPTLIITVPLVMEKLCDKYARPLLNTRSAKLLGAMPGVRLSFYKSVGEKILDLLGGRIKTIIIGGAPLDWKVESIFKKIQLPYAVGYGMTEACPLLAFVMPGKYVAGSCGRPIHEVRIDSSDPERIPGEIQSRGPNLTVGYYKNPEADAAAWTADGWLRTGDLGIMDENGNLFIRGRIKSLILSSSGQNIYPEEIEQVLSESPVVEESIVLDRGGKIVALVYPKTGALSNLDAQEQDKLAVELRNLCNQHLPKFSQIASVEWMDLPFERTAKGSIKRHLYK